MKKNKKETQLDLFPSGSKSENVINEKPAISTDGDHCTKTDVHNNGKVIHMQGHLDVIYERILNRTMS